MKTLPRILAGLPAGFKGKLLYRIGGRLTRHSTPNDTLVRTNLGMPQSLRLSLPLDKPQFAFGSPMTYLGERGVLYLSQLLSGTVDAVMDVGANWGYFTYFLRPGLDERIPIYYFEPNGKLFDIVGQNVRNNGFRNVHGVKKGIAGHTGTASFFVNLTNDLSSTLDGNFVQAGEQVVEHTIEVVSFDDFVAEHGPDKKWLVKVDIENAEPEFVKGAAQRMGQVEFLIIEFLEKARKSKLADQITDQFGMNAYYINDFKLEYMPREDGRYTAPEYNFLFCRHKPEALRKLVAGSPFSVVG